MTVVSPWDAAKQTSPEPPVPNQTGFEGKRWRLFWSAFRLGFLTILTLGFYRFWMKTRLRRWYWSAWRPGGYPLEYVGDPWEKLLGFLIAVVFLAFYIGIVNLLLMFASFSLFNGNMAAYVLSFLGVVPLWFYARYRARRYVLARTRWCGVRFGLEPGAWGFAARALWHWFLTIVTLGLLWPRKAFYLEKYITDRTYFGAQKLWQNGSWTGLLRPWLIVWVVLILTSAAIGYLIYESLQLVDAVEQGLIPSFEEEDALREMIALAVPILAIVAPVALMFATINYNVKRQRYLHSHKSAGPVTLSLAPRFWKVTGIYVFGYGLAMVVSTILLSPIAIAGMLIAESHTGQSILTEMPFDAPSQLVFTTLSLVLYFLVFLLWAVLMHAFIRFPLMRHFASVLTIRNLEHLNAVTQRPRDEFGEAEGFAEALDVGAAI